MAGYALQVPGGPVLEFQRGLFSWKVTANGQRIRPRGVLVGRYELAMPDGSLKTFRIVGFLNGSVEIDAQRTPVERRLKAWELVLSSLPLVLAIPAVTGGILGFVLAFTGLYANTIAARSIDAAIPRAAAMLATTAAFLAIYVVAAVLLVQLLRGIL